LLEAIRSKSENSVKAAKAWLVPLNRLSVDNLTAEHYSPFNQGILSNYETCFLKDIASIFKGSPLTLDKTGNY
jgi:hypothetical protein